MRKLWWVVAAVAGPLLYYAVDRVGAPARAVRVFDAGDGLPTATAAPGLAVLAYNIAHGRGAGPDNFNDESLAERDARLHAIADVLRGHDVVVLNEVDFDATWSHRVDQAETLARLAGYRHVAEQRNFDFAFPLFVYRFGNAILSRTPLERCRRLEYPARSPWEARLLGHKQGLVCETVVRGHRFALVAIHLEHRDEATRVRSAQYVLQQLDQGVDAVLAGDFNSAPPGVLGAEPDPGGRTAVGLLLTQGGYHTTAEGVLDVTVTPTFPTAAADDSLRASSSEAPGPAVSGLRPGEPGSSSFEPRKRIDWVLVPRTWQILKERVWSSRLSDHAALWALVAPPGVRPDGR